MGVSAQTKDTLSFKNARQIYIEKNYETALQQFLQLSERYSNENNKPMLAKTYYQIGVLLKKNKDYTKSKRYYFRGLKYAKGEMKAGIYNNLASLNYAQGNIDSCKFYYKKTLKDNTLNIFKSKVALANTNLSGIYILQDSFPLAIQHLNKARDYYEAQNRLNNNLVNIYNNIGGLHYKNENFKAAKIAYEKAYSIIDKTSDITIKRGVLKNLTRTNYILGNTTVARKLDSIHEVYLDSVHTLEHNAKINEIEAIHNEDNARAEEALNTEQQREAKLRTQYALAGTGLVSLIIILIGTILYRNSKLKAKTLSLTLVEQELNQQKTLRVLEERNQSKLLNATLDGRETERKDIAQTLHDSVSALLSSANMHLQVAKKKSTSSVEELEKSQRIIDEASGKVRDLSHKLISAVLLKFGLEHAVYDMCEKYSNSSLEFELESEDKIPRFEQNFEIKLHNIIQECINNIIKHSKATEASVFLLYTNNTLNVVIKDNGVGFDVSKISPSSGIGLSQIKARIENLGGEFVIKSSSNSGTEISFKTPVINA
jgi:signal transduction histidine kinase